MKLMKVGNSSLVSWELYRYGGGIYVLRVGDPYARAMLFLRYQEHYESPDEAFRGKSFDIFHFMNAFRLSKNSDIFTYPGEWMGFNIPGDNLLKCIEGVRRGNEYDIEMKKVVRLIRRDTLGKCYLLGVDNLSGGLMDHELAHAFYYLDRKYRIEMNKLALGVSKKKLEKMNKLLLGWGYREEVLLDELQAYLGTGLGEGQDKIFSVRDCVKFINYFNKYKSDR